MPPTLRVISPLLVVAVWTASVQRCPADDVPLLEKKLLFDGESAKTWSAAESTLEPSNERVKLSPSSLHWHVTVDYNAGEVNYPVGWPRVGHAIAEPGRDWSDWEFLSMWVYVATSREALPREPVGLGLHTPDKASAFHRPLLELKKGEWVQVMVPIADLPGAGHDVRHLQLHISESSYSHGDTLDLYLDDLVLVRHAAPVLEAFASEASVIFSDARCLPVRFQVLGVKTGSQTAVVCELRQDGATAVRGEWKVGRGAQRCLLELGEKRLRPGNYELAAWTSTAPVPSTATLRVVESPWEETAKEVAR